MEEEGISLLELLKMILKNWILMILFLILGVVLGICYTMFIMDEEYTSESSILVVISSDGEPKEYDYNNSLMIINTVSELATQSIILNDVSSKHQIHMNQLSQMITVKHPSSSLVLIIEVTADSEALAMAIADEVADSLILECSTNPNLAMIGNALMKTSNASTPTYTGNSKVVSLIGFILVFLVLGAILAVSKEILLQKKHLKQKNDVKVANELENI